MADIIYTKVMPTASEAELGKKYKYMGENTDTLVKGKIYECTSHEVTAYGWRFDYGSRYYRYLSVDPAVIGATLYEDNFLKNPLSNIIQVTDNYIKASNINPNIYREPSKDNTFTVYEWAEYQRPEVKYFSQANVAYLLSELTERIKQSHINE